MQHPEQLNLFLAYDAVKAGRSALALLDHIAAKLKNRAVFNTKLWRFDLMTLAACAPQVEADSSNADVVVVAFGTDGPVPLSLFQWLGGWAARRHVKDAALGALPTGAIATQNALEAVETLQSLARHHGLRFIHREAKSKGGGLRGHIRRPQANAPGGDSIRQPERE